MVEAPRPLGEAKLLSESQTRSLLDGYDFLLGVETSLRRIENKPVSALPAEVSDQAALAKRLGFKDRDTFWNQYESHRKMIRDIFESVMGR